MLPGHRLVSRCDNWQTTPSYGKLSRHVIACLRYRFDQTASWRHADAMPARRIHAPFGIAIWHCKSGEVNATIGVNKSQYVVRDDHFVSSPFCPVRQKMVADLRNSALNPRVTTTTFPWRRRNEQQSDDSSYTLGRWKCGARAIIAVTE